MPATPKNLFRAIFCVGLFLVSLAFLAVTPLRKTWQDFVRPPKRKILAVATGEIFRKSPFHRVAKISSPAGLFVEVYGPFVDGISPLMDTIKLPDHYDAYFTLAGKATNLALRDMDGDQVPEILVPTYDDTWTPHLNIFRMNQETKSFEPYIQ